MSARVRTGSARGGMHAGPLHLKRQTITPQFQYSVATRNAQLDALGTLVGGLAVMQLRSGQPPPSADSPDAGQLLAELVIDAPFPPARDGELSGGPWSGTASATGLIGHFRVKDATRSVTLVQGTAGRTGSGAAMEFDRLDTEPDDIITVETFAIVAGNP